jgi:hypothetical protein
MNQGTTALKNIRTKVIIFSLGFILLIIGYFFILNLYSKKILNQIEEINLLKEKINQAQAAFQKESQLQKLKILIEQKTEKDLPAILFDIQQKIDRDFEKTKNLVYEKIQKENWQIIKTTFNQEEKRLNFIFQIPDSDFSKFYDFMVEEGLVWQTIDLKIYKNNNLWQIELNLKTK